MLDKNCYILVKILSSQKCKVQDILNETNMNIRTFQKCIKIIKEYLTQINISKLIKEKNEYYLDIPKEKVKEVYNNFFYYTNLYRIDYLFFKLFLNQNLNLEHGKSILDISRTTIKKDLFLLSTKILKNKVELSYKNKKGYFFSRNDDLINKYAFLRIMKHSYEISNIPLVLKESLPLLNEDEYNYRIKKILLLCENFNIEIGTYTLNYIFSLDICFEIKREFNLEIIEKQLKKLNKKSKFQEIRRKIKREIRNRNLSFKINLDYIAFIFYNLKYKKYTKNKKIENFIELYCNFFQIKISKKIKYFIYINLFSGMFRFNHEIFLVQSFEFNKTELEIINQIKLILKEAQINILNSSLVRLMEYTKLLLTNKKIKIKIIILSSEIIFLETDILSKYLLKDFKYINLKIESSLYENRNYSEFDIIISDNKKIKSDIYFSKIEELTFKIKEFLIRKGL